MNTVAIKEDFEPDPMNSDIKKRPLTSSLLCCQLALAEKVTVKEKENHVSLIM